MFDPTNNNFYNPLLNQDRNPDIQDFQPSLNNRMDPQLPYLSNSSYPVSQPPSTYSNTYSPNDLVNRNNNFYAEGGEVRKSKKKKEGNNPYAILAELIRQQGGEEDVVLAHINPLEEQMLATLSGGRKINPKTGLPQYGFFNKPGKWFKSIAGGIGGAVLGNLLMPGLGGVIGGALGNAAGEAARGRKNYGAAALKGAGIGAGIPSLSSALSSGANALGATNVGSYLGNYGNKNAILPALGRLTGMSGLSGTNSSYATPAAYLASTVSSPNVNPSSPHSSNPGIPDNRSFLEKLTSKTSDFLTEPANLLTTGVLASSFLNKPKKQTPESLARDKKRYENALMLSPEELRQKEASLLAEEQMRRRIQRNKFLPEERLNIDPVYVRTSDPEEYRRTNKWLNYYNNPQFAGAPLVMKKGGSANPSKSFEMEIIEEPRSLSYFLEGIGGGQDDDVPRGLRPKSYIVDASTVSDAGDGNSMAGAEKINAWLSNGEVEIPPESVARLGKGNIDTGTKILDQLVKNIRKHKRGGSTKLPPKAKSLSAYMR